MDHGRAGTTRPMVSNADPLVVGKGAPAAAAWRCAMRDDLVISRVPRGGTTVVVVKDPVGHRFFELSAEDYSVARALDPDIDWRTQASRLAPLFEHRDSSPREILRHAARVSRELRANGLAKGFTDAEQPSGRPVLLWLRRLSSVLFIRWKICDPTYLMQRTARWAAPLLHPPAAWASAVFLAVSAAVFLQSDGMRPLDLRWFSEPQAWLALYAGIALLKFFHEWAHAAVVHHFGGAVHDAGVILVAGLPLFYVDASDSYLFRGRAERIAVAAAGIAAELLVGALLVWPWWLLGDGFAKQLLQSLILLAVVSTILFNANPLMRFDGYYILADTLGMPDLRRSAREFCTGMVRHAITGGPRPQVTRREAWIYGSYGTLSYAYLVCIILGIWRFLSTFLEPLGLKWIGNIAVGAWAASALVIPASSFLVSLFRDAGGMAGSRRIFIAMLVVGIVFGALFLPVPSWVGEPCVLEPADAVILRSEEQGFVELVSIHEGSQVVSGQPLVVLRNRRLGSDLAAAESRVVQLAAQRDIALADQDASQVEGLRRELLEAAANRDELKRRVASLTVTAPAGGHIGTRNLEQILGQHLAPGDIVCTILLQGSGNFLIPLSEASARKVKKGASVVLRVRGFPFQKYTGTVSGEPLEIHIKPPVHAGTPNHITPPAPSSAPDTTHYVHVEVQDPGHMLKPGMTGRVRIACGTTTTARAIFTSLMDFIRLDVRMR